MESRLYLLAMEEVEARTALEDLALETEVEVMVEAAVKGR
jgi:hypothetical protein